MDDVRDVLVIRPGGLGDVVHAVPALRQLRATYPTARVTVAAGAHASAVLEACPFVDRAIDVASPSEALVEQFDIAISFASPHDAEQIALTVDAVDARRTAAWSSTDATAAASTDVDDPEHLRPAWPTRLDARARMLRLTWLLGGATAAPADSDALGLWPTLTDRNGAARLVEGVTRPLAVVHVGAAERERRWPVERWSRVIDAIDAAGVQPVLVGTARDRRTVDDVVIATRCAPRVVVEQTHVGELAGLLERSMLFVGGDSGPAALAGALGVRSVIVAPASMLEHVARPGVVDLITAGACATCGELACMHTPAAATDVPLEAVLSPVSLAAASVRERWEAQRLA